MISLVLTSMLLTAVAAAFSGASQAIEMNDNHFRCTQAARVSMDQILAEIRNCDTLDMGTANTIRIIRPAPGSGPYSRLLTTEVERELRLRHERQTPDPADLLQRRHQQPAV